MVSQKSKHLNYALGCRLIWNNRLIPSAGLLRYFTWLPGIENNLIRHSWIIKGLLLEGKEKVQHKLDFLFTELYPLRSFTYDFSGDNPLDDRFLVT
jgi:hypothetical protein